MAYWPRKELKTEMATPLQCQPILVMYRRSLVQSFTIQLGLVFSNYYLTGRFSSDCKQETRLLTSPKKEQRLQKKIFVQIFTRSITSWQPVKIRCEFWMQTLSGCKNFLQIQESFLKMALPKNSI